MKYIKALFISIFFMGSLVGSIGAVDARLIFSNENPEWDGTEFVLDVNDDAVTNIDLKFGNTPTGRIRFDVVNDNFKINKNVDFELNELVSARLENVGSVPTCDGTSIGRIYLNTVSSVTFVCTGTLWTPLSGSLSDNDGDTKIQVEEGVDDDTIRFDTAGTERLTIGATGIFTLPNTTNFTLSNLVNALNFDSNTLSVDALNNRIGIGTASPTTKFQVVGQTRSSSFSAANNTASTPAYRFESDANTGLFLPAADTLGIATAGIEQVRIDSTGNVLIGSTSETLLDPGFILNGSDVFIADTLGVEGAIYTDDTQTKYQFLDIYGCVRGSASAGTVAGGNSPVIRFDSAGNSHMRCSFPVPDDWVSGTDINIETYWSPSNNGSGNIDFDLLHANFAVGETIASGSFVDTIPGATYETVTASTQLDLHTMMADIPAAGIALDDMVNFRLRRTPGDAGDTYGGNVNIHMIRISYTGKKLH